MNAEQAEKMARQSASPQDWEIAAQAYHDEGRLDDFLRCMKAAEAAYGLQVYSQTRGECSRGFDLRC